jgi:hypothetical protein
MIESGIVLVPTSFGTGPSQIMVIAEFVFVCSAFYSLKNGSVDFEGRVKSKRLRDPG